MLSEYLMNDWKKLTSSPVGNTKVMSGSCPGTTLKAQELKGCGSWPVLWPCLPPTLPSTLLTKPTPHLPGKKGGESYVCLFFFRCTSESFGHVFQKFSLRFLIDITLNIDINFKRNYIITTLNLTMSMMSLYFLVFFHNCFHIVSAYLLLNYFLGYVTFAVTVLYGFFHPFIF